VLAQAADHPERQDQVEQADQADDDDRGVQDRHGISQQGRGFGGAGDAGGGRQTAAGTGRS